MTAQPTYAPLAAVAPPIPPEVANFLGDVLVGGVFTSSMVAELKGWVEESAASDDPARRRQSLFFRMWRCVFTEFDAADRERRFAELEHEYVDGIGSIPLDSRLNLLCNHLRSDAWILRGEFDRSLQAIRVAKQDAQRLDLHELHASLTGELGFAATISGHVEAGLAIAQRAASPAVDVSSNRLGGARQLRHHDRHAVIDLADVYDHTRQYQRAIGLYEVVVGLISPGLRQTRIGLFVMLARCLSMVGETALAEDVYHQGWDTSLVLEPWTAVKSRRAEVVIAAQGGDLQRALELCTAGLASIDKVSHRAWHQELLLDGTAMARAADEPKWVIEQFERAGQPDRTQRSLPDTYAFGDMAWAYQRLGQRRQAQRYFELAASGRRRWSTPLDPMPFPPSAPPGLLSSAASFGRRSRIRQETELQSLHRGIGSAAHDVRNQLLALALVLDGANTNDDNERLIDTIISNVDNTLDDLIRDTNVEPHIRLVAVNLAEIVGEVATSYSAAATSKEISLQVSVAPNLQVWSDPAALNRIVSNLISNAVKYTPIGGEVHISSNLAGSEIVDLNIEDTGPGVPDDEIERLFEWGVTLSTTPTDGEPQHGIGLYTAQRLAMLTDAVIQPHPRTRQVPGAFTLRMRGAQSVRTEVAPQMPAN